MEYIINAIVDEAKGKKAKPQTQFDISTFFQEMILDDTAGMAYYSYIMQRTRRVCTDQVKTMAIGMEPGGFVLYYNPEFAASLSYGKFCYVIKHELMHVILGHHSRGDKNPKMRRFDNVAMDLAINSLLGQPPEPMDLLMPGQGQFEDFPHGQTYEQYYNLLLKKCKKGGEGEDGLLPGEPQENGDCEVTFEGHDVREQSEGEAAEVVAKKILDNAYKSCKAQGKLPANLERIIEGRLKAKVNWRTAVRRFHGQFHITGQTYTNKRASRRYPKMAGVIPGAKNKYSAKLLVALDTSGSCFNEEVFRQFLGEVRMIPIPYTLVMADASVQDMVKVRRPKALKAKQKGGGGTDFKPVFELAKKGGYDGVIYITDMFGDFPDSYKKPTLWVSISDVEKAPFGKVVKIKLENEQQ